MSHLNFANINNLMAIYIKLKRETTPPLSPKKCHRQQKAPMTHYLQDCRSLFSQLLLNRSLRISIVASSFCIITLVTVRDIRVGKLSLAFLIH